MTSGLKMLTSPTSPSAEQAPDLGEHVARALVAVVRELGHQRAVISRPAASLAAERRRRGCASAARWPPRPIALPDAYHSKCPWPGQSAAGTAGRRCPATMWPISPAPPLAPRIEPRRRMTMPPPMPGAERQHQRVGGAARRAVTPLGEHRAVGVVVDGDRQPEPLGHQRLEADALERQVRRGRDDAAAAVDHAGHAEADARDLALGRVGRLDDHRLERGRAAPRCREHCDARCAR